MWKICSVRTTFRCPLDHRDIPAMELGTMPNLLAHLIGLGVHVTHHKHMISFAYALAVTEDQDGLNKLLNHSFVACSVLLDEVILRSCMLACVGWSV